MNIGHRIFTSVVSAALAASACNSAHLPALKPHKAGIPHRPLVHYKLGGCVAGGTSVAAPAVDYYVARVSNSLTLLQLDSLGDPAWHGTISGVPNKRTITVLPVEGAASYEVFAGCGSCQTDRLPDAEASCRRRAARKPKADSCG